MTATRRIGAEDSATRTALLDAAQQLMLEEGYAAVTSRRVAAKAGLKPQLVHYYFRTMDDLFLALVRRGAEQNLERQARALASPQPLRALWAFSTDPAGTALDDGVLRAGEPPQGHPGRDRGATPSSSGGCRAEALAVVLERHGIDTEALPPAAVALLITSISQILVLEEALGLTTGHAEMRALVERCLARVRGRTGDLADEDRHRLPAAHRRGRRELGVVVGRPPSRGSG